ncbi:hypothetical protein FKM82_004147 [Ascaphus truei]
MFASRVTPASAPDSYTLVFFRASSLEEREDHTDRLEFVQRQLVLLNEDIKKRTQHVTEQVNTQVSSAMMDEIRRLSLLVDDFDADFHSSQQVLKHYKNELNMHIEKGMGRKLADRCSNAVNESIQRAQEDVIEILKPLLPPAVQNQISVSLPCKTLDLSYNLNCERLCCEFQEDIEFRFSLGWTSLINRFLGATKARRILLGFAEPVFQIPRLAATPPEAGDHAGSPGSQSQDELVVSLMSAVASLTSRTSMSVVIVAGVVWRTVGWKLIALSIVSYGGLYTFEWLTWTTRAKERTFKQQFVSYATRQLERIVSFTSANCSHQVKKELENTFTRLCQQVDVTQRELVETINKLTEEINHLENTHSKAKLLRHKATHLENELDNFAKTFLHQTK